MCFTKVCRVCEARLHGHLAKAGRRALHISGLFYRSQAHFTAITMFTIPDYSGMMQSPSPSYPAEVRQYYSDLYSPRPRGDNGPDDTGHTSHSHCSEVIGGNTCPDSYTPTAINLNYAGQSPGYDENLADRPDE